MEKKYKLNKRALSLIVTTVLLIALTVLLASIILTYVRGIIKEKTTGAKECFDATSKITINTKNTCYDKNLKEIHFSINIKNISIDELRISFSNDTDSEIFTIKNESSHIEGLKKYGGVYSGNVSLPSKEAGTTYIANLTGVLNPYEMEISPKMEGKQCGIIDSYSEINSC